MFCFVFFQRVTPFFCFLFYFDTEMRFLEEKKPPQSGGFSTCFVCRLLFDTEQFYFEDQC